MTASKAVQVTCEHSAVVGGESDFILISKIPLLKGVCRYLPVISAFSVPLNLTAKRSGITA